MAAAKEFKFKGISRAGQPVQGTVFAASKRKAREKVEKLSKKHNFRAQGLQQRRMYLYKVRHPSGEVVKGEQKAFSEEELEKALRKMGLEVISVQKKLFHLNTKPGRDDVIMFVRLSANLLKEKLPFDEVLGLLVNDVSSKSLKHAIRDLNADLKGGTEAEQAFMKHQHVFGKFTAYMLGIASKSGNMAEIYDATARFLERKDEFRKSIRSAMITPAITVVALIACLIWYVWYIFPETARLFQGLEVELPPLTLATLAFADWLDANWGWCLIVLLVLSIAATAFVKSDRGTFLIHKYLIRIPVLGELLHKLNIEVFCRVFSVLYSGSGDNIGVIKIAAEACGNRYIEHQVKTVTVPMMVAQGSGLVKSMEASGVFTDMAVSRFRSGAETGNVQDSARQMADYYERETTLRLKNAVESIQTAVAIIITIGICFLTVLSTEIAFVQPDTQSVMGM